jgi:hypothetical protein
MQELSDSIRVAVEALESRAEGEDRMAATIAASSLQAMHASAHAAAPVGAAVSPSVPAPSLHGSTFRKSRLRVQASAGSKIDDDEGVLGASAGSAGSGSGSGSATAVGVGGIASLGSSGSLDGGGRGPINITAVHPDGRRNSAGVGHSAPV